MKKDKKKAESLVDENKASGNGSSGEEVSKESFKDDFFELETASGVGTTGDPLLDEALSVRDRAAAASPEEAARMQEEIDRGYDEALAEIPPSGKGMKIFKIIVAVLLALIVVRFIIIMVSNDGEETQAALTNVTLETVATGSISQTSPVSGRIQAADTVDVYPLASGEVTSVKVNVGDYVTAGQVLFTIDSTQATASYNQAQAQQSSARASYDQAGVAYTTAQSQYKSALQRVESAKNAVSQAETAFNRSKTLYSAGTISKAEYESAENALTDANSALVQAELTADQAKESIRNAEATLQSASAGIQSAQATVTQASDALGHCVVKAPSSGYINTVNVVAGSVVSSAAPGVSISDTSVLEMKANISEYLINSVKTGDQVEIYISSLSSEPFSGVISEVGAVPAAGSLTYPVKIRVTSDDSRIKAGMFAEVRLTSAKKDGVMIIPSDAVMTSKGANYVFTVNGDNVTKKVDVTVGVDNGTIAEITSGIQVGDRVVVKGQDYIEDGETVNVVGDSGKSASKKGAADGKSSDKDSSGKSSDENKES